MATTRIAGEINRISTHAEPGDGRGVAVLEDRRPPRPERGGCDGLLDRDRTGHVRVNRAVERVGPGRLKLLAAAGA